MTKRAFDKIAAGLKEAAAISKGDADPKTYRVHVPAKVDVRAIRKRMGLTQEAFAMRFGFSAAAVKDWEQERKVPEAVARVLLTVIDREPEAVSRALTVTTSNDDNEAFWRERVTFHATWWSEYMRQWAAGVPGAEEAARGAKEAADHCISKVAAARRACVSASFG